MKHLYLWDDLMICDGMNRKNIQNSLNELFEKLRNKDNKYTLIKENDLDEWVNKIDLLNLKSAIKIGTRPNRIKFNNVEQSISIKLQRKFTESGFTEGVDFDTDSKQLLLNKLSDKELVFIEDVLVCGRTIEKICEFLDENNFKGKAIFNIFIANRKSIELLKRDWKFELEFNVHNYMEGKAIEESTLLCLHDLMYGKLGNKYYKERVDLLERFFYSHVEELLELITVDTIVAK